ncbi:cilia- and flagella-associated protein 58-like [Trematomus bernacchii]|uniref:cilia- and flagella-associated protein 58-like n=1 Tax=Trematomus bernacchii TaxID=40690 RepID=UPI001469E0F8|nr:cilia- and flagella-associated protein 58-like [Trematomus bernacchii]
MKPSNDLKARNVALQDEIHRAKINEKHLMDQNAEQERKISSMVTAEMDLKKEELKNAGLKHTVKNQTFTLEKTREELDKLKVEHRDLETVSASEKKDSEQKMYFFKRESLEYQNKLCVEKSLRQQKEKEAEMFGNHQKENRMLNMQVEKLSHNVKELTGYKCFSIKTLEEQRELLRKKDKEVATFEKEAKKSKEFALTCQQRYESLKPYREKLKVAKHECERQSEELKKHRRLDDVHRTTEHGLHTTIAHWEHKRVGWENKYANLEVDMEILREANRDLITAAEMHEEEVVKERNLVKHMELEVKQKRDLKIKLHDQERKMMQNTNVHGQEIIHLRALTLDLEKRLTLKIIHADSVEAERNLLLQNQLKEQVQQSLLNKNIQQLQEKLQDQTCETDVQRVKLARLGMERRCMKNQLQKVSQHLAESKMTQDACVVSADRDQMLGEMKLVKMATEKETLEKELQTRDDMVVQLQLRLNQERSCQDAHRLTIKEHELQKRQMWLEMKRLKQVPGASKHTSRRAWTREKKKRPHAYVEVMKAQHRHLLTGKLQSVLLLEKKDEVIEELRRMLARRPDDAIQKMQQLGWDNRRLSKELMAVKGTLGVYQAEYDNMKEENERVKEEKKTLKMGYLKAKEENERVKEEKKTEKMDHLKAKEETRRQAEKVRKSESGDMNQQMHLPPISKKTRHPAEETAKDQGFSGYKPRPNRVIIKSKCVPEMLKSVPLPSIPTVKLVPHPPPKRSQHPTPRRRSLALSDPPRTGSP